MGKIMLTASTVALVAGAAHAGGIDRSGQSVNVLFEKGNYVEFSFGTVNPSVSGVDLPMRISPTITLPGGADSGNVANNYLQYGFSFKSDINDRLSYAVILDEPFGADIQYPVPGSARLGGTLAKTTETALTTLLRYKLDENWSVYGGLRAQRASGEITLSGQAYGPFSGYHTKLDTDYGLGYVVGAAYERPDIALRVSLTYNSKIKHELDTTETFSGALAAFNSRSITKVETPQSINLDFQTGVAANTLVFGGIRWVNWADFDIDPINLTKLTNGGKFVKGGGLVDLEDTTTYTIGVGRKFNDTWSGAASISYEEKGDPLVSPLAPSTGRVGVTLAAIYTHENMKITTGVNYTKLGDTNPETGTPDVARANFSGNHVWGVGVRVGYTF